VWVGKYLIYVVDGLQEKNPIVVEALGRDFKTLDFAEFHRMMKTSCELTPLGIVLKIRFGMVGNDLIEARNNILRSTNTNFESLPYKDQLEIMRKFAKASNCYPPEFRLNPGYYFKCNYTPLICLPQFLSEFLSDEEYDNMNSLISDGLIRRIDELESHSLNERERHLTLLLLTHCRPNTRLIDNLREWYNERMNQMKNGVLALAIEQAYRECDRRHLPVELTKRILKLAFGF
jgi:hypothetical protein